MAVSITPVVGGAAMRGPPPPASSIYSTAIRRPSCDQRGRAAYPFKWVSFLGFDPSALSVQSCRLSFSPASDNSASVLESGDHAGSASILSPEVLRSIGIAGASPD